MQVSVREPAHRDNSVYRQTVTATKCCMGHAEQHCMSHIGSLRTTPIPDDRQARVCVIGSCVCHALTAPTTFCMRASPCTHGHVSQQCTTSRLTQTLASRHHCSCSPEWTQSSTLWRSPSTSLRHLEGCGGGWCRQLQLVALSESPPGQRGGGAPL
jgi:hypothetical protein